MSQHFCMSQIVAKRQNDLSFGNTRKLDKVKSAKLSGGPLNPLGFPMATEGSPVFVKRSPWTQREPHIYSELVQFKEMGDFFISNMHILIVYIWIYVYIQIYVWDEYP